MIAMIGARRSRAGRAIIKSNKRCSMLPVSTLIIVSIGYLTKRNHHRLSNRVFFPTEPFSLRVLQIEKFRIDPQNTQRIGAPPPRRARRPTAWRLPTAAANSCSKASTWGKSGTIQLMRKASTTSAYSRPDKWGEERQMRFMAGRFLTRLPSHRSVQSVHHRSRLASSRSGFAPPTCGRMGRGDERQIDARHHA